MAKSPGRPPGSGLDNETPWVPSPASQDPIESATAAAEGFSAGATSAEEAIGGGSHRGREHAAQAAHRLAIDAGEKMQASADRLVTAKSALRNTLEDAIVAQPITAVAVAAIAGFMAAVLFRR